MAIILIYFFRVVFTPHLLRLDRFESIFGQADDGTHLFGKEKCIARKVFRVYLCGSFYYRVLLDQNNGVRCVWIFGALVDLLALGGLLFKLGTEVGSVFDDPPISDVLIRKCSACLVLAKPQAGPNTLRVN